MLTSSCPRNKRLRTTALSVDIIRETRMLVVLSARRANRGVRLLWCVNSVGTTKEMNMKYKSREELEREYRDIAPIANRFCNELVNQLGPIVVRENISLGFPIEYRVKSVDSIVNKIDRLHLKLTSIKDLQDLIGLRLILLFNRDVEKICQSIAGTFNILKQENTLERLKEDQFGYSSIHFVIKLPDAWLTVPSLSNLGDLNAEIQVRTVAQHIWAAASHLLQYKNEENVPLPVRRSISRVSALLETVDLEFERVLEQRDTYRAELNVESSNELLNVDLLEKVLDSVLPTLNKDDEEDYGDLLTELYKFDVKTPEKLKEIIQRNYSGIMEKEAEVVNKKDTLGRSEEEVRRILKKGVFYSHTGLTRMAMGLEFGDQWHEYMLERSRELFAEDDEDEEFDDIDEDDPDDNAA